MRRSLVVKLILMNSLLGMAGCSRAPDPEQEKKEKKDEPGPGRGSYHHRGHGGAWPWIVPGSRSGPRSATGTIGRGGFGARGHASS